MRIEFERSGGVGGLMLQLKLDTANLPETEASELQQMVNQSGFFSFPERGFASTTGADQFNYRLTVEMDERRHTVEVTDISAPATLQPLLQRLARMARSGRYT